MTNPIREALEAARPLIALGAIEPERIAEEHAAAAKIDVALALLDRAAVRYEVTPPGDTGEALTDDEDAVLGARMLGATIRRVLVVPMDPTCGGSGQVRGQT